MHFKVRTPRCPYSILSRQVSSLALGQKPNQPSALLDKALAHVPRDKIREQLVEVGFDSSRQNDLVGSLSGGWKMKLELARAMLYNADLLLLDEVCPLSTSGHRPMLNACFALLSPPTMCVPRKSGSVTLF